MFIWPSSRVFFSLENSADWKEILPYHLSIESPPLPRRAVRVVSAIYDSGAYVSGAYVSCAYVSALYVSVAYVYARMYPVRMFPICMFPARTYLRVCNLCVCFRLVCFRRVCILCVCFRFVCFRRVRIMRVCFRLVCLRRVRICAYVSGYLFYIDSRAHELVNSHKQKLKKERLVIYNMAAAQPPRIIDGERRGGHVLLHNGYRYQRNRTAQQSDKIYWRCADQMCRVPLQTNYFVPGPGVNIAILGRQQQHPHLPEFDRIERQDFVGSIKRRIEADPSLQIRRAYETEYVLLPANLQLDAPTFDEVRSSLHRHRSSFVPIIPGNINMVNIQGPWGETVNGNRKLLAIDNNVGVSIFASDEELRALSQCQEIFIDGTFKTAPQPYRQIISIHGKYTGWTLPLVMAMSTGKTEIQYRYLLRTVCDSVRNLTNTVFAPTIVVTDFEIALVNAIRHELPPPTATRGCYFHFAQSIMRKVSKLGLRIPYQHNPNLQNVVRRMLGLGYIPVAHVRLMFV